MRCPVHVFALVFMYVFCACVLRVRFVRVFLSFYVSKRVFLRMFRCVYACFSVCFCVCL